jgi:hypothetical protein
MKILCSYTALFLPFICSKSQITSVYTVFHLTWIFSLIDEFNFKIIHKEKSDKDKVQLY